ncbi:Nse4 C-terminal-domain-containing protein [Suillus americanus]|nr:Nse4 C-terminal-domain-containing protein [Suillus americanus]
MVQFDPNVRMGSPSSLPYDPDQDAAEKRDIRKKYRALEKRTGEQLRPQDIKAAELVEQVEEADELFQKVKNPTEATLDSTVLRNVSSISAQKARAMKLGSAAFDIDDFVSKLAIFMGGRHELADDASELDDIGDCVMDWEKVGRRALAKSRRVPVMGFMLGPLSVEQKKRASVKRAKLEKSKEEERRPQEIKEEDIQRSENETTKNVIKVREILEESGSVNLLRFVINPNDFAQSVENIFYLSFLIRDGLCALEIDENGEPIIFLCEAPSAQDRADGVTCHQIVMEFDMATWRRAIEVFEITESMIPQRPAAKTRLGGKWYG